MLDGEAIALREDGRPHPFQVTGSRFASRSGHAVPLTPMFFDLLHLDGEDLLDRPGLRARRGAVGAGARSRGACRAAGRRCSRPRSPQGHEGVVVKALDAPYEAGRRGAAWVKVKPVHTLDLVVLGVEWGSGRRRGKLSNLHLGARGPDGGFVMLGKTFKGLTDAMLAWQTEQLLALEERRDGHVVYVRPELVVEIAFDGVQTSPRYPGGVALRFARVLRYRPGQARRGGRHARVGPRAQRMISASTTSTTATAAIAAAWHAPRPETRAAARPAAAAARPRSASAPRVRALPPRSARALAAASSTFELARPRASARPRSTWCAESVAISRRAAFELLPQPLALGALLGEPPLERERRDLGRDGSGGWAGAAGRGGSAAIAGRRGGAAAGGARAAPRGGGTAGSGRRAPRGAAARRGSAPAACAARDAGVGGASARLRPRRRPVTGGRGSRPGRPRGGRR